MKKSRQGRKQAVREYESHFREQSKLGNRIDKSTDPEYLRIVRPNTTMLRFIDSYNIGEKVLYNFEDVQGKRFVILKESVVKVEDFYVIKFPGRGRRYNRGQQSARIPGLKELVMYPLCFKTLNITIDKNGNIKERKPSQTYENELAKWNKVSWMNKKAKLLNSTEYSITNNKITQMLPRKTNAVINSSVEKVQPTYGAVIPVKHLELKGNIHIEKAQFNHARFESVVIGDRITSISKECFAGCKTLNNVTIGENVTSIGMGAFSNCINLNSVKFENNKLYYIGSAAFMTTGIQEIKIPNGVQKILNRTFASCVKLKKVIIPASVKNVDETAFLGDGSFAGLEIVAPKHLKTDLSRLKAVHNVTIKYY